MGIAVDAEVVTFVVTTDRDRGRAFYRDVLGFPVTHEDAFAVVFDLNGIMLRMSSVEEFSAAPHTVLGWAVADIVETVGGLRHQGVAFVVHEGLGQDELGIWRSPGDGTRVAWFRDPDGNLLSVTEFGTGVEVV